MKKILAVLFVIVSCISLSEAMADKDGKGHGKWKKQHSEGKDWGRNSKREHYRFRDSDRVIIRNYIVEDYHSHCPPGLAKKGNGCLPPGQAKKLYVIGQRLPDHVEYYDVPQPLLVQLQPAPIGHRYVRVDRDALLMNEATHKIVDAITLMSALGN